MYVDFVKSHGRNGSKSLSLQVGIFPRQLSPPFHKHFCRVTLGFCKYYVMIAFLIIATVSQSEIYIDNKEKLRNNKNILSCDKRIKREVVEWKIESAIGGKNFIKNWEGADL